MIEKVQPGWKTVDDKIKQQGQRRGAAIDGDAAFPGVVGVSRRRYDGNGVERDEGVSNISPLNRQRPCRCG